MCTNKYVVFYVLFLIIMPFKLLIAQDVSADSAVINELEDKYDSVITKAALSLTGAQYKQASDYYQEASLLKPQETYPLKMIKYVEGIMADIEEKQKRSDELKRKAQIKDDLNKANNAIVTRSWDSARVLFSEILTLHPEKADADYAKSKVEAIDLELKRIALRTPPKKEPVIIAPPKNRSEARARRKMAERNATIATASAQGIPQKQAQAPTQGKNTVAAPLSKEMVQKPAAALPPPTNTSSNASVKAAPPKPIQAPLVTKSVITTAPAAKEVPQRPVETTPPVTNPAVSDSAANEAVQRSIETPLPAKKTNTATATDKEIPQRPGEMPPPVTNPAVSASVANKAVPRSIETPLPAKIENTVTATNKEIPQRPIQTTIPADVFVAPPKVEPALQKPIEKPLPAKKVPAAEPVINQAPPQSTEVSLPEKTEPSLSDKEIPVEPANGSFLKLSDSSDYIKLICKDISFIGTNAYVKVLIQNYSSTASFLTDTLQVSIKKNNGTVRKLDQRFISSFPVVTPLQETILVAFTDASAGVGPDDIFILEMRNRKNKTTLALQIPWALYQQQKNM